MSLMRKEGLEPLPCKGCALPIELMSQNGCGEARTHAPRFKRPVLSPTKLHTPINTSTKGIYVITPLRRLTDMSLFPE